MSTNLCVNVHHTVWKQDSGFIYQTQEIKEAVKWKVNHLSIYCVFCRGVQKRTLHFVTEN